MSPNEFRKLGLLHEVNRRILHPLGLALEVLVEDNNSKTTTFGKVHDYRDDPEGMRFQELDQDSIDKVKAMEDAKRPTREKALGYWVQGEE